MKTYPPADGCGFGQIQGFPEKPMDDQQQVTQWLTAVEPANASFDEEAQPHTEPSSPVKLEQEPALRASRSVPSVSVDDRHEKRHRNHHHHHPHHCRHRSSSVGSRGHRSRKSDRSSSSEGSYDSDDEKRRRQQHRTHSRSREKMSDSDVGYNSSSRSDKDGRRHRQRSRKEKERERDGEKERDRSKRHKRPREVKREDKERTGREREAAVPPAVADTGTAQGPWPQAPSPGAAYTAAAAAAAPGAITIPQHIVIPPTSQKGRGQPQRFHINSEITISYSDRSTNPSESEAAHRAAPGAWTQAPRLRQRQRFDGIAAGPGPTVTSPTDGEMDQEDLDAHRVSYGAESSDSKGHGSTAV